MKLTKAPCAPHHLFIEVTMLYVVECAYTDPQSEAAWNTFYNQENYRRWSLCPVSTPPSASALSARAAPATWRCTISTMLPSSTATPTAATAAAIARWQSAIADWHRHLYLTNNTLREVARMKCCCWAIPRRTCPSLRRYSCSQAACATEQTRYAAILHQTTCITSPRLPPSLSYQPITARLRNPAQRA